MDGGRKQDDGREGNRVEGRKGNKDMTSGDKGNSW